jgi:hypothetical protein
MYVFFSGVAAAGNLIAAAFFLRFWSQSRETLFLFFAGAFGLFSITPILNGLLQIPQDQQSEFFLFRLAGFLLIIAGIGWTNLRRR